MNETRKQYLTMLICGETDDPGERGHWSSPEHVKQQVDAAVAKERQRCAKICEQVYQDHGECPELAVYCAERILASIYVHEVTNND